MKIAFHSNQLGLRGSEIALFDYAHFNETLLGNQSIIVTPEQAPWHDPNAIFRFKQRFPVHFYSSSADLDSILKQEHCDVIYMIKSGQYDGMIPLGVKVCVHAVFPFKYDPHGAVYATISRWMSKNMQPGIEVPYVPHMINLPNIDTDLRENLCIPKDAIVFGRHGGYDTFDIDFVKSQVIPQVLAKRDNIYFVFLGTRVFIDHPRVIFIPGTSSPERRVKFVNTCNACIHARQMGESFGLVCGEFSIRNKPVFTWNGSPQNAHLDILGYRACTYSCAEDLENKLLTFDPLVTDWSWDAYSQEYNPQVVMQKFKEIFL